MDIMEQAEIHIWEFLQEVGEDTEFISTGGTLENLMNDGWTPTEISAGKADDYILDNVSEL